MTTNYTNCVTRLQRVMSITGNAYCMSSDEYSVILDLDNDDKVEYFINSEDELFVETANSLRHGVEQFDDFYDYLEAMDIENIDEEVEKDIDSEFWTDFENNRISGYEEDCEWRVELDSEKLLKEGGLFYDPDGKTLSRHDFVIDTTKSLPWDRKVDIDLYLFERASHAADDCDDIEEETVIAWKRLPDIDGPTYYFVTLAKCDFYGDFGVKEGTEWRVCRYVTNDDIGEGQDQGVRVELFADIKDAVKEAMDAVEQEYA